jgi:hypothetical protein
LYAALELRLGIEARLHEYLDAADEVATLKKRGWQVSQLAKNIDHVFKLGEKIASFAVLGEEGEPPRRTFLYTPVSRRTRQIAERLGDYLHFTPRFAPRKEAWWQELHDLVEEGIRGLDVATTGTLLAPPLLNKATGEGLVLAELPDGVAFEMAQTALGRPGETIKVRVDYHEKLPKV